MRKIMMLILIILGSIFTAGVAIMQYLQSEQDKIDSGIRETKLNSKVDNLLANNKAQSSQLIELSKANTALSQQLASTSSDLVSKAIGGSLISLNGYIIDESTFRIQIKNIDKNIIFNSIVSVLDLDRLADLKTDIIEESETRIEFSGKRINEWSDMKMGDINVGNFLTLDKEYKIEKMRHFAVEMQCRKNLQVMQIIVEKVGNTITSVHRVYEVNGDKWTLVSNQGTANEAYWKEKFFNNKRIFYNSMK